MWGGYPYPPCAVSIMGENTMITKENCVFIYDDSQSYKGNFYRWFAMNSREKEIWGDKPYNVNEALEVYKGIWGDKQHNQRNGILKQLEFPFI